MTILGFTYTRSFSHSHCFALRVGEYQQQQQQSS